MKRMTILNIFVLALLCIIGCSDSNDGPTPSPEKIVCDKFNLKATLDGQLLKVSIDTDLPDDTELMVSVSRPLNIVYDQEEYLIDYLSEKSTVGQWRGGKTILLDNNKLLLQLVDLKARWHIIESANQDFMSDYSNSRIPPEWKESLNKKHEVDKISDTIEVSMVVPINQSNPRFGWRNENLVGKAVSTKDLRIVEGEVQIHYPLKKSPTGRSSPGEKLELKGESLPYELMDKLKAITFAEAVQHIERVSSLTKTKRLEDETALILGRRVATILGKTVVLKPLWHYKRGSLYCINGAAKNLTADIPFTYEVDALTAFKLLDE